MHPGLRRWVLAIAALVLSGCSSASSRTTTQHFGSVSGLLQEASFGPNRSIPGTVTLEANSGQQYTVRVPPDGKFSLRVPTGTYTANGGSPEVRVASPDSAEIRCYDLSYIHVVTGVTVSAVVLCRDVVTVGPHI